MSMLFNLLVLAALLFGVWKGLRWPQHRPPSKPPLTITEADGWTVIDAQPAPLPSRIVALSILAAFCFSGPVFAMNFRSGATLFVTWVVTVGLIAWILIGVGRGSNNARRRVQSAPFAVRSDAVRLPNGAIIMASQVYALTQRNTQDGQPVLTAVNSTIGAMSAVGAASTAARLATISHAVDLDHDGRSSTLAGGLTEPQARAVFMEVRQRLHTLS